MDATVHNVHSVYTSLIFCGLNKIAILPPRTVSAGPGTYLVPWEGVSRFARIELVGMVISPIPSRVASHHLTRRYLVVIVITRRAGHC
jgi:hypothetical protein